MYTDLDKQCNCPGFCESDDKSAFVRENTFLDKQS